MRDDSLFHCPDRYSRPGGVSGLSAGIHADLRTAPGAVAGELVEIVEGDWNLPRTVLLEFPDMDHARNWLADPEYGALARHRHRSAQTNLVLVEGVA